jgi:hypothetical protein
MAQLQSTSITGSIQLALNSCGFISASRTFATSSIGNFFFNPFTNKLQYTFCGSDGYAWSSRSAMITGRNWVVGTGTTNATLGVGGALGAPTYVSLACVEAYNGSTWSAGTALATARDGGMGAGTQSDSLYFAGASPGTAETCKYNGTSWSAGGAMISARYWGAGAGQSSTSAIATAGRIGSSYTTCTEIYNGTSWSAGGAKITGAWQLTANGTVNAALAMGGYVAPAGLTCVEKYNGTAWATGTALPILKRLGASSGTQTAAINFAGTSTATYIFNGMTWSGGRDVILNRGTTAGALNGTTLSTLYFSGDVTTCTEEYGYNAILTNSSSICSL